MESAMGNIDKGDVEILEEYIDEQFSISRLDHGENVIASLMQIEDLAKLSDEKLMQVIGDWLLEQIKARELTVPADAFFMVVGRTFKRIRKETSAYGRRRRPN